MNEVINSLRSSQFTLSRTFFFSVSSLKPFTHSKTKEVRKRKKMSKRTNQTKKTKNKKKKSTEPYYKAKEGSRSTAVT